MFMCPPAINSKAHGNRVDLDIKGPGIFESGPVNVDVIIKRHCRKISAIPRERIIIR
jgi:hypothetical protein